MNMRQSKNEIRKMLEFSSVFFIFERLGLDVVTSEEFKNAVYKKAEKDTRYWLLNAPMS